MFLYFGIRHFYVNATTKYMSNQDKVMVYHNRIWDYSPGLQDKGIGCATPLAQLKRRFPGIEIIPIDIQDFAGQTKKMLNFFMNWTDQFEIEYPHAWYGQIPDHLPVKEFGQDFIDHLEAKNMSGIWGAGSSKIMAKLAAHSRSGTLVAPEEEDVFLRNLSIDWLPISDKAQLHKLGVHTIGELSKIPTSQLKYHFGNQATEMVQLALGKDIHPFSPVSLAIITWEIDFRTNPHVQGTITQPELIPFFKLGAENIEQQLIATNQVVRQLALHYDTGTQTFETTKTLPQSTRDKETLIRVLSHHLPKEPIVQLGIRGVHVEKHRAKQLDIFFESPTKAQLSSVKARLAHQLLDLKISRREKVLEMWESSYL